MTAAENVNLNYLSVSFQQDLQVLICRWHTDVNMQQFAEGYLTSLTIAKTLQANFWLQDLRNRNTSSKNERAWFEHTFVPDIAKELPNTTHIAYLMSPLQKSYATAFTPITSEEIKMGKQLMLKYFVKEQDALLWLDTYRPKVIV